MFIPYNERTKLAIAPSYGKVISNVLQPSYNLLRVKCVVECITFSFIISLLLSYSILQTECMVENDPHCYLREVKLKHAKCIVCAHLNINSLRNKFEQLKGMIISAIDILIITETKLDDSFPPAQFNIDGLSKPYRLDRTGNGGVEEF